MGEFVSIDVKEKNKYSFGPNKEKPQKVYLQFVPGLVLDVTMNSESPTYEGGASINSIIAQKHYGSNITYKSLINY